MVLGTKIVTIAIASVFVTATAGLLIQRSVIRQQGIAMMRDTMRATILSAENARRSVSTMRTSGMFDDEKLKASAVGVSDYKKTNLYKTVPVVAAWDSITEVAEKEGYEFRVPAKNPRNQKNAPRQDEERILSLLENDKLAEYFAVDESSNEIVYGRPIVLTNDCMVCHGEASSSPTKNGKDMLGFQMEGWKAGDKHGMFLLRSKLTRVDAAVQAGLGQTAMWLFPMAIGIGIGVYFLISKISNQLHGLIMSISQGSSEVTGAVAQISKASHSLAQGASEQAASLEQTSASSEQVSAMTRRNADHSRTAANEMGMVSKRVQDSHVALDEMSASMASIKTSSSKIENIIKVIDEIAFQTNILALNAAVEAARAGEAGAGFAVVADEVRNLALRSAQAARDTAPLIEDSIAKSNEGSVKLNQVAEVIRSITESAARVKVLVDEVNQGSQEQSRGMEQVSSALLQLDKVTQSNAASAEESASASVELAAQAETMDDIAQQLRMVVEG